MTFVTIGTGGGRQKPFDVKRVSVNRIAEIPLNVAWLAPDMRRFSFTVAPAAKLRLARSMNARRPFARGRHGMPVAVAKVARGADVPPFFTRLVVPPRLVINRRFAMASAANHRVEALFMHSLFQFCGGMAIGAIKPFVHRAIQRGGIDEKGNGGIPPFYGEGFIRMANLAGITFRRGRAEREHGENGERPETNFSGHNATRSAIHGATASRKTPRAA